jgi:hypothetical protein
MTVQNAARKEDRVPGSNKEELNRLLIEEFYKDSVSRYGTDSEQARMLSRLLGARDSHMPGTLQN